MRIDFDREGYFCNSGKYDEKSTEMRLTFQQQFIGDGKQIVVRLLEARGYGETVRTGEEKDSPCETSIYLTYEDARALAEFLLRVTNSEQ